MRLVVDTSVLVGEVLRSSGRELLHHEHLELFLPQTMDLRLENLHSNLILLLGRWLFLKRFHC